MNIHLERYNVDIRRKVGPGFKRLFFSQMCPLQQTQNLCDEGFGIAFGEADIRFLETEVNEFSGNVVAWREILNGFYEMFAS